MKFNFLKKQTIKLKYKYEKKTIKLLCSLHDVLTTFQCSGDTNLLSEVEKLLKLILMLDFLFIYYNYILRISSLLKTLLSIYEVFHKHVSMTLLVFECTIYTYFLFPLSSLN